LNGIPKTNVYGFTSQTTNIPVKMGVKEDAFQTTLLFIKNKKKQTTFAVIL